jgi:hypothetical protein
MLLGPIITLTNGVEAGIAHRDWLRHLLGRQSAGTLTVPALLDSLRRRLES